MTSVWNSAVDQERGDNVLCIGHATGKVLSTNTDQSAVSGHSVIRLTAIGTLVGEFRSIDINDMIIARACEPIRPLERSKWLLCLEDINHLLSCFWVVGQFELNHGKVGLRVCSKLVLLEEDFSSELSQVCTSEFL